MNAQVWHSPDDYPAHMAGSVVTVGNFDGVHRGHQAVISTVVNEARERGLTALAVTFDPHPKAVHDPLHEPELISAVPDRVEHMAALGLDAVLVQHYTLEWAMQTPQEFVRAYLVEQLRATVVVVGRDTRFGRGNAGDLDTMRMLGEALGFEVVVVDDAGLSSVSGRRWSSSWARELIDAGDMRGAAEVLGRPHRLRGTVVDGDKLGRVIGFPTANLEVSGGMIPRHGVYAGWLTVANAGRSEHSVALVGQPMPTAVSLGINYTVGGTDLRVEGFVMDREGLDLYGCEVTLDLVEWRRPMLDFGSAEALVDALAADVVWCREILGLAPA